MITLELFLFGLLITSTLTGLTTEAFKKVFAEHDITYKSNTLAGVVALFISGLLGIGYITAYGLGFNSHSIMCLVAQIFMSWLCAMLGYDKVIQTMSQFKSNNKE